MHAVFNPVNPIGERPTLLKRNVLSFLSTGSMSHCCAAVDCVLKDKSAAPVHGLVLKLLEQLFPSLLFASSIHCLLASFFIIQTAFRLGVEVKNGAFILGVALQLMAVKYFSHLAFLATDTTKYVPSATDGATIMGRFVVVGGLVVGLVVGLIVVGFDVHIGKGVVMHLGADVVVFAGLQTGMGVVVFLVGGFGGFVVPQVLHAGTSTSRICVGHLAGGYGSSAHISGSRIAS